MLSFYYLSPSLKCQTFLPCLYFSFLSPYFRLYTFQSFSLCVSVRLSVLQSVCRSVHLSVRPSVHSSDCLSVSLSACPFVCVCTLLFLSLLFISFFLLTLWVPWPFVRKRALTLIFDKYWNDAITKFDAEFCETSFKEIDIIYFSVKNFPLLFFKWSPLFLHSYCHFKRRHDTQHNDIQHNDSQHAELLCDTQHNRQSATPLSITIFSITTFSIMTFSITKFNITTFSITTFSIMTLCIRSFYVTLSIRNSQHEWHSA